MNFAETFKKEIFQIKNDKIFSTLAIKLFHYQYSNNTVYRKYVNLLNTDINKISAIEQIPFLPIEFFRNHKIITGLKKVEKIFISSGTTSSTRSTHYVTDISIYKESLIKCFEYFYGDIKKYCILALVPSYKENQNSSLSFMVNELIKATNNKHSGFYLHNTDELAKKLKTTTRIEKVKTHSLSVKRRKCEYKVLPLGEPARTTARLNELFGQVQSGDDLGGATILIGLSFALLDFAEKYKCNYTKEDLIVIETGGMKGRREEITREELHKILCSAFKVKNIHSEYGMAELLSQAYSKAKGIFNTPPWMKFFIRDINDPFNLTISHSLSVASRQSPVGSQQPATGIINIIDLTNINSCAFIATNDIGKFHHDGGFEVLGRMAHADIRGCSLMIE